MLEVVRSLDVYLWSVKTIVRAAGAQALGGDDAEGGEKGEDEQLLQHARSVAPMAAPAQRMARPPAGCGGAIMRAVSKVVRARPVGERLSSGSGGGSGGGSGSG